MDPMAERRRAASTESELLEESEDAESCHRTCPITPRACGATISRKRFIGSPRPHKVLEYEPTPRRPFGLMQKPVRKHPGHSMSEYMCLSVHAKDLARRGMEHGLRAYRVRAGRNLPGSGAAAGLGAEEAPTPARLLHAIDKHVSSQFH